MSLKDLIATESDRVKHREMQINMLRDLLRDVYDVAASGERISEGLLSRIRCEMAHGRKTESK